MTELLHTLCALVDAGKVPHAILLHEEDGGGAVPLALKFLEHLFGEQEGGKISKLIHPDVQFVFPTVSSSKACLPAWRSLVLEHPRFRQEDLTAALGIEGKSALISVAEAKEILATLSLSALEGGWRAVLMYLPEKMNAEAANRLLKMVEEPPAMTQFVFVTHAPEKVLPTITSRCQRYRVMPEESGTDISANPEFAAILCAMFDAVVAKDLLALLGVSDRAAALPSRENVAEFCRYASAMLRQLFLQQQGLTALQGSQAAQMASYATALPKTFPRKALAAFDRALLLTGRNVNLKLVFTELAGSLYRNG
jgi:DNA polymerase-3 subunit delta'